MVYLDAGRLYLLNLLLREPHTHLDVSQALQTRALRTFSAKHRQ